MSSDAITTLRQQLNSLRVEDAEGVLEYIPLAARLAALGETEVLRRWRELAPKYADFSSALADRCREGIWDLEQTVGEELGLAIIEAQDFHCFAAREGGLQLPEIQTLLAAWAEHAEEAVLDEEAAGVLRDFLERFPLPPSDRLAVVDCPVTALSRAFVAAQAQPRPIVRAKWPRYVPDVADPVDHSELCVAEPGSSYPSAQYMLALSSASPSDRLKRVFEGRVDVDIPRVGYVIVNRSVSDDWKIVVDLELSDDSLPDIEMVRVGLLPLTRTPDEDISRWMGSLMPFEHMQRLGIMTQPVVVLFTRGHRLEVT